MSTATINENNSSLMRLMLNLHGKQKEAFVQAIMECSDQLRADAEKLMAIVDDVNNAADERGRAWNTLLDQFHLLPDDEGRYGMDLVRSESAAAEEFPMLAREVAIMDDQEAQFAERLRKLMKDKCITQKQLAKSVGCSQPAISQMLNRKCRPQRKTLEKMATALDVDIKELWPDLGVVDLLDAVAEFGSDNYVMTEAEAAALRDTDRPKPKSKGKALLSWKEANQKGE